MTDEQRLIEVLPYDPAWPRLFEAEAALLRSAIGDNLVALEHIGSTSVPGLAAKPIIDIIPILADIHQLDAESSATKALEAHNYEWMGEYGLPGRRYLRKRDGIKHLVHLHCYQEGDEEILRHTAVRDYLRAHPQEAAAYGELKLRLAPLYPFDSPGYQDAKDEFVQALEQRALQWAQQS